MKENKGQISGEYLLLSGVLIIVLILALVFIASEDELTRIMAAARNGAIEGMVSSSSAIYPIDAYGDYSDSKTNLLNLYSVELINVSYNELGMDDVYEKKKIQFNVYAKSFDGCSKEELDSIGDRINYNLRKSIAISFNTTSSTNELYNPVFTQHYVITTANVKWV